MGIVAIVGAICSTLGFTEAAPEEKPAKPSFQYSGDRPAVLVGLEGLPSEILQNEIASRLSPKDRVNLASLSVTLINKLGPERMAANVMLNDVQRFASVHADNFRGRFSTSTSPEDGAALRRRTDEKISALEPRLRAEVRTELYRAMDKAIQQDRQRRHLGELEDVVMPH